MHHLILSTAFLAGIASAIVLPYVAPSAADYQAEGLDPNDQEIPMISSMPPGGAVNRAGFIFTADSAQGNMGIYNAMDDNSNTIWHSEYSPVTHFLPHTVIINTKKRLYVNGISYRPRQDGSKNGNIGQHKIYTSTDGNNWGDPIAYGTWYDDQTTKSSAWETRPAQYIKIVAITEAGNRGPWSSAANFDIYTTPNYQEPEKGLGSWGPTIDFPLVPAAAAIEPDTGNVLTWSSYAYNSFTNGPLGKTLTSIYNPSSGIVTQRLVTNTQHDMFCPGISFTANGLVVVTGGNNALRTSIFNGGTNTWTSGSDMYSGRGYQSQVTLGNGNIFVIGGSWSGNGANGRNGEYYVPATNTWRMLPNSRRNAMLTKDGSAFRQDNHSWLFGWKNNIVFQAGPSQQMNWFGTTGTGATVYAGQRGNDFDSMCGNAVMWDANAGNIVTFGGSINYDNTVAHANANTMSLGNPNTIVNVQNINSMWFARIFHTSVVLPNGEVFITGGQRIGIPFHDDNSVYTPEMWNPGTTKFVKMQPNGTPRNYHSFSLLMTDATVINGGGGLCTECSTNHFDAQIYTPQYLLNPDGSLRGRPVITGVSSRRNAPGARVTVTTNTPCHSFSMIRYGSATHTVNTDQRRIPLTPTNVGNNRYAMNLGPNNYGQVTPGYWMLFAMDGAGTPSKAYTILIA